MTNEMTFRHGEEGDAITLKRGGRDITFKKVRDAFAVRLEQGSARNEAALEASLGQAATEIRHVDSMAEERMDVYRVGDAALLEETMDGMRQASNADVVTHLYTIDATPNAETIPTGTLTIQFEPSVAKAVQEGMLSEFGLEVTADLDFLPNGHTVRLTQMSTENPLKIAAKLQHRDGVELVEPDLSVQASFEYVPSDPLYQDQWHLENRGDQLGLELGADVSAEEAWDQTLGSRTVTVCVIDDGFDLGHPEFDAPEKIVAPRDFGQNDLDPNPVSWGDKHGTACAGVALAEENGSGIVGMAPRCAFMPMRMAGVSDNSIVDYFQYAIDNGADVISCSWSARPWYYPLSAKASGIIHKAATMGRSGKGIVILFAAGNQNRPLNGTKDGRVSFQGFALHPDVLAVGASNSKDTRSSYSNYGSELTLCAPSSGSPGRTIVTADRRGVNGYSNNDYTYEFGGTSSATPLAAGVAALMLTVNPALTAAEVRQIMMDTTDKIDLAGGHYANGHSPMYGAGRINAARAVRRARQLVNSTHPLAPNGERVTPLDDGTTVQIVEIDLTAVEATSANSQTDLEATTIFELSGTVVARVTAEETDYRVQVFLADLERGETHLATTTTGVLQAGLSRYVVRSRFGMPSIGRYELRSRVVLQLPSCEIEDQRTCSRSLTVAP